MNDIPVITIDGPGGTGKGTVSLMLAKFLGWHFLDSGAIYRALAWAIMRDQVDITSENVLIELLKKVQIHFEFQTKNNEESLCIHCDGQDITTDIRSEACAMIASQASALPVVRAALLDYQRDFRRAPGLVTDGRDMGTVVFPNAQLKFYLTASPEERARRRYQQLQHRGINVTLPAVQEDLNKRDLQDQQRKNSPTIPAGDAIIIDTTHLNVDEVFSSIVAHVRECFVGHK